MSLIPPLDKLKIPVIGSPLFIISNPDLVIAQCKAGIVGSFPCLNAREEEGEPNMLNICSPSLECVNTMGPMIADAPGICKPFCPNNERRDEYGNCITNGCQTWFDGCNSCQIGKNGIYIACSRIFCEIPQNAECRDNIIFNGLNEGDICYRFCEDNSMPSVNRRNDCPSGTQCVDSNTIGFDTCGERASICMNNGH